MGGKNVVTVAFLGVVVAACTAAGPREAMSTSSEPSDARSEVVAATSSLGVPTTAPTARPESSPTPRPESILRPLPHAPTDADHWYQETSLDEGGDRQEQTHTVLWRARSPGMDSVLVYGVTRCVDKPARPKNDPDVTGPCLMSTNGLSDSVLQLLATAPASDGWVRWTWVIERPDTCAGWPWDELFSSPSGERYYAIVVAASNAAGKSSYVIADPGEWQGAYMGCGD